MAKSTIDESLAYIEKLPPKLKNAVITNCHLPGKTRERALSIMILREELLKGKLPNAKEIEWPGPGYREKFLENAKPGARFCRNQEQKTDELLLDLLENLEISEQKRPEFEKQEKENQNLRDKTKNNDSDTKDNSHLDDEKKDTQDEQIKQRADDLVQEDFKKRFTNKWRDTFDAWNELENTMGELAQSLGENWSYAQKLIGQGNGWGEITRLRELVRASSQIREIIRQIGKLRDTEEKEENPSLTKEIIEPISRWIEEMVDKPSPRAVAETRGITRSDDIYRMLPSESALLGSKELEYLWHARRAEQSLITYQVVGVENQKQSILKNGIDSISKPIPSPKQERGPILICLDTSGSMSGQPEKVAKALSLEACIVAKNEGRCCYLFSFSGKGQISEHELSFNESGIKRLVDFLLCSFDGGTDVDGPLKKAIAKLNQAKWRRADILIISDGGFSVSHEIFKIIENAKINQKLRIHGVLVGHDSHAMKEICNPLHTFKDWNLVSE